MLHISAEGKNASVTDHTTEHDVPTFVKVEWIACAKPATNFNKKYSHSRKFALHSEWKF